MNTLYLKKKQKPTTLKDNSTFYLTFFFLKWREVTDASEWTRAS